jgi:glycosyltransferase involved in cell wall biosynthesis
MTSPRRRIWYVVHEEGAPSHYIGLNALARARGASVVFYEFRWFKHAAKGLVRGDFKLFLRGLRNLCWLIFATCGGVRQQVVVIGIAPFDWRLACLWPWLRRNSVFWHTSWPNWTGGTYGKQYPKPILFNGVRILWNDFIYRRLHGILFVTATAQQSFTAHVTTCPNNVVWHAFDPAVFYPAPRRPTQPVTIGYAGRLEQSKGIELILGLMAELQGSTVRCIIVGSGTLRPLVTRAAEQGRVEYRGLLKGSALAEAYREMDFLLLPSQRTAGWEEAFGIVTIEAMACGVVPLVTDHPGPVAILQDHFPQFIFTETAFRSSAIKIIRQTQTNLAPLAQWRECAIKAAQPYNQVDIARRWQTLILPG